MSDGESKSFSLLDLGDLAKPAEILVERFCDGIGGVFQPRQIRRIAKAEADADIIKAKANLEVSRMSYSEAAITDVGRRAIHRIVQTEIRNQINMEEILALAIENLDESSSPDLLSDEFTNMVFDNCKDVSNKELQELWGRLIASEAKSPGLARKNILKALASMDREDAELFQNFCNFLIRIDVPGGERLYPIHTDSIQKYYQLRGILLDELHHLASLGLVSIAPTTYSFSFTGTSAERDISVSIRNGSRKAVVVVESNSPKEISVGKLLLTKTGESIAKICHEGEEYTAFQDFLRNIVAPGRSVYNLL